MFIFIQTTILYVCLKLDVHGEICPIFCLQLTNGINTLHKLKVLTFSLQPTVYILLKRDGCHSLILTLASLRFIFSFFFFYLSNNFINQVWGAVCIKLLFSHWWHATISFCHALMGPSRFFLCVCVHSTKYGLFLYTWGGEKKRSNGRRKKCKWEETIPIFGELCRCWTYLTFY